MNKLRYAKEGAKDIVDRACAELPWKVSLQVDGNDIEIPEVTLPLFPSPLTGMRTHYTTLILFLVYQDAEGVLVLNIGSYMGGVDLWQNDYEHNDDFELQSMHDEMLEVVCISGTWHLSKLQVCYSLSKFPVKYNI